MAGSVSTEDAGSRPVKTPKVDEKAIVESKPPSTFDRLLMIGEPEKDEYVRQYLLFRCQYYQTRGFGIEWEKFDYHFSLCYPYDGAPPNFMNQSNEERIKEVTQLAIDKYNQDNGTNIVFVEHVSANYRCYGYFAHWVTFWGRDMSSPCPVSKLYQAKILHRRHSYQFPIFRVKPTDEEMMAAPIRVKTPLPWHLEIDEPPVVFRRARPGEDPVPGTPFVYSRDGGEYEESDTESDEDEWIY